MKDLSRRKFLTGAAVAVPAAAVVVALPQIAAQAAPVPMEYAKGFVMDAWPGAEVIVPDRVLESSAPLGEGGEADYTIDFEKQTIKLNAPCTGIALYQTIKALWRDDPKAIVHPYPMMAITPELFTVQDGWKLTGVRHLQNASLEDDGYGNRVLGCISLGQVFEDEHLLWAPGSRQVIGYWHLFHKKGHVNQGVIFPSKAETIWIKCGEERTDMGAVCGSGDMSRNAPPPIRFPIFQQYDLNMRDPVFS